MRLYEQEPSLIVPHMDAIARTCLQVLVDEKTADGVETEFKFKTGLFIKTVVA